MKKILFINSLDTRYGSTYRARHLCNALRSLGYAVFVLESNYTGNDPDTISIEQKDSAVGYLCASIVRAVKTAVLEYDLLYIQKFTPLTIFSIIVGKLKRKKLLVDWDDRDSFFQKNRCRRWLTAIIENTGPLLADAISTHSSYIADEAQRLKVSQVYRVPQIVDTDVFDPEQYGRERMKERFGLSGKTVAGYVGTLTEGGARDLDVIIQGVAQAAVRRPDLVFLLVGGGPLEQEYRERIARAGIKDAVITGVVPQKEIPGYIACMDLGLIYMREDEGNRARVSLKLLEYLAMNCSVVGKVTGETKELLGQQVLPAIDEKAIAAVVTFGTFERSACRDIIRRQYSREAMKGALQSMMEKEL